MKKRGTRVLTSRISRNICPTSKRAQMKLSFGMIFSIFLIIIFLSFAIYVIIKFINLQHVIQIGTFKDNLQADINLMWQSQQGTRGVEYYLPNKINAICFTKDGYQNLIFDSEKQIEGKNIEHINIESITSEEDPYCIENIGGKVSMTLVKEYGKSLVKITR